MLLTTHFHYSNRKVEFTFHESLSITPSLLLFSLLFMHPLDLPILELKISKIEFISTQSRFSKPDTQTTLEVLQNKTIFHFHFTFFFIPYTAAKMENTATSTMEDTMLEAKGIFSLLSFL